MSGRPARGGDHPGGGRGDRAVVVEDRQHQRLQHHALGERAGDGQDRRAGEEQLALGVAVDVAGEPVVGQPAAVGSSTTPVAAGSRRPARSNRKSRISSSSRAGAGDDAVAPAGRQPAGEHLEDAAAVARCRPCSAAPTASSARSGRSAARSRRTEVSRQPRLIHVLRRQRAQGRGQFGAAGDAELGVDPHEVVVDGAEDR